MANMIYHERQVKSLCAVHALNNLFQEANAFSKESLDQICKSLDPDSWINGHKSIFGIGDYDINVIDTAVRSRGYETRWFDRRPGQMNPANLNFSNIFGFVMNVPSKNNSIFHKLSFTSRRHWYAIRSLPSQEEAAQGLSHFYNLDSFLDEPRSFGGEVQMVNRIRFYLTNPENYILLVITPEVAVNETWKVRPTQQQPSLASDS